MVRVFRRGLHAGLASALFSLSVPLGADELRPPEGEGPLLVFHVGEDRRLTIEAFTDTFTKPVPDPARCTAFVDPCPSRSTSGGTIVAIEGFRIGSHGAGSAADSARLWIESDQNGELRDTRLPEGWKAQQLTRVGQEWRIDIETEHAEVPLPGNPGKGCWIEVSCSGPEAPAGRPPGVQR